MRLLALVLSFLAVASAAFAQDTTVQFGALVDFILPIVQLIVTAVIAAAVPVVVAKMVEKWGLQIEQQKRDALQTTFTNAAAGLIQRLGDRAHDLQIDVKNPEVAQAVQRVVKGAPDALRWAGLDEREIARRVLEKLPQISPTPIAMPLSSGKR